MTVVANANCPIIEAQRHAWLDNFLDVLHDLCGIITLYWEGKKWKRIKRLINT